MSYKAFFVLAVVLGGGLVLGTTGCSSSSKGNPVGAGGKGGVTPSGSGGSSHPTGGAGGTVGATGGVAPATGGVGGAVAASGGAGGLVGGKLGTTQCSDGIDNDGDGKIDLQDPECVSPLDNDESSFATGIPGDNVDACKQDCFFDGNSGMGDDGCEWELKCDPSNIGAGSAASCPYDPSYKNCPATQSQKCVNNCQALTPNGCDCFGCCAVPGVDHPIRLDATCTAASFGDPTKCPVCTQQTSCMKTCDKCQLCLGKTTLDPSCAGPDGGTPTPICPDGQTVCGTDPHLCPETASCITGCCVPYP
ncbi:MAG TPA: hypothetical protein VGP07_02740 [Polyangia bacterium]|jgi:hypothetical protein